MEDTDLATSCWPGVLGVVTDTYALGGQGLCLICRLEVNMWMDEGAAE